MDITKALEIVEQYKNDHCISGTLETLQDMDNNVRDLTSIEYSAFTITMREFRKLFAPVTSAVKKSVV
jgi:hypothetical protein